MQEELPQSDLPKEVPFPTQMDLGPRHPCLKILIVDQRYFTLISRFQCVLKIANLLTYATSRRQGSEGRIIEALWKIPQNVQATKSILTYIGSRNSSKKLLKKCTSPVYLRILLWNSCRSSNEIVVEIVVEIVKKLLWNWCRNCQEITMKLWTLTTG